MNANVGQSSSRHSAINVALATTDILTVALAIVIGMAREITSAKSAEASVLANTTTPETTATNAQKDFTISPSVYVSVELLIFAPIRRFTCLIS